MIPVLLWILTILFIFRVAGQLLVALHNVPFLPSFDQWYSGILPYRFLLPAQLLIIGLMIKMCLDVTRKRGYFAKHRPWFRKGILYFGIVYLGAMVARFAWFGISIPVVFHWFLAGFLILFAIHHRISIQ